MWIVAGAGLLGLVVCGFLVFDFASSHQTARRNYSNSIHELEVIGDLQYQAQEARRTLLYALATTDSNRQVGYADESRAADAAVGQLLKSYRALADSPAETEASQQFGRTWDAYLVVRNELISSMLEGNPKQAIERDLREGVAAFNRVRDDLLTMKGRSKEQAGRLLSRTDASFQSSLVRLIASLALALGLGVVVVVTIRKSTRLRLVEASEAQLRQRVAERTRDLTTANSSLEHEVEQRKQAVVAMKEAQNEITKSAHLAGMAEVATGVLHNVGNVLNSVNVSANLMVERVRKSKTASLARAVRLLGEHKDDAGEFLTRDPKGRQIPAFLEAVSEQLTREQAALVQEMQGLQSNIEHIKHIVAMQQSYAKVSGVLEPLPLVELVEDALRMSSASFARHGVAVVREFAVVPPALVDRHKVLQILVNLISNAKQAMDSREGERRLTFRIHAGAGDRVLVEIADNGMGIPPENLTRIFNHGFTTKKTGHGFGLHSCANAAAELGGSLTVRSEGPGLGATFTLELPAQGNASQPVPPSDDELQELCTAPLS